MEILIQPDGKTGCLLGARVIARKIREKPDCVLGLATGRTPLRLYGELVRMHREEKLDFCRVTTFNLDEYVGLAPSHPQSYRHFMEENFFSHVNIDSSRTHVPEGTATDLRQACRDYERAIRDAGGIDLQLLGLGNNGHIGFNEPTGSLNSRTWIKILSEQTLRDNAPLFPNPADIPKYVITMGVGTILDAKHCLLLTFGRAKSQAVKAMIEGAVSSMCPASALQLHPRVTVVVDEESAGRLDYANHYRWIDAHKLDWQKE